MAHFPPAGETDIATVSVVIPSFNGERYIGESLASVLAQTHVDVEAIVVDDGSTDRSVTIARGFRDPRVRVITQANAGVAAARNRGVAEASGEYVAFLDQDDAWLPEKLTQQLPLLGASAAVGLVYCDCFLVAETGAPLGRWSERYPLRRGRLFDRLIVEATVPISTVLLRRSTFGAVGGFRTRYRFVEDLDLLLRVAALHTIEVVDRPLAKYRLHAASTSRTLGIEIAAEEFGQLCDEWMARDAARGPSISRALARYHYLAGKTAFYQGNTDLARRYLAESVARDPRTRTRLFAAVVRHCPGLLSRARQLVQRLRGRAGATPGTFPDRFA